MTYEMPFCTEETECGTKVYIDCLPPDSPFIDAGSQYIDDTHIVGMTTDWNNLRDNNEVDLGVHSSYFFMDSWGDYMNAGQDVAAGDINQDGATDWPDLQLLAHHWLWGGGDANDINNDGIVNLKDFAIMAETWYKIQGHPNITAQVSGNLSNLSGDVDVNVVNFGPWAWRAFVLMDGQFNRYPRLYRRGTLKFKLRLSCVFLLLILNVFSYNRLVYANCGDEKSF